MSEAPLLNDTQTRPRRSCLAVPAINPRFLDRARQTAVDQVFFDLEDSCPAQGKAAARQNAVAALNNTGFADRLRTVRINQTTSPWAHLDVISIVEGAGANLDTVMVPKVERVAELHWLDILLEQTERAAGLKLGGIGIEVVIERPAAFRAIDAIAAASPRITALIYGGHGIVTSTNPALLSTGSLPLGIDGGADYHPVLLAVLTTARAHGQYAMDGPYDLVRNNEGYRLRASQTAALGFDGKWALHPDQVTAANEIFSPTQEAFEDAYRVVNLYREHLSGEAPSREVPIIEGRIIDEPAFRRALVTAANGKAAGLTSTTWPVLL